MNPTLSTILVAAILILVVGLILWSMIRRKKQGKNLSCSCGSDCSSCHASCPYGADCGRDHTSCPHKKRDDLC